MSLLKKYILLALFGLLTMVQHKAFAQEETESKAEVFTAKNSAFAEFWGNSGGYSLNYGRIFYQKNALKLATSAGFSLLFESEDEPLHSGYIVPAFTAELSSFYGKSKHNLELGLGFNTSYQKSYAFDEDFPNNIRETPYWHKSLVPRLGYRYQKPTGGLFFRASYTPSVAFSSIEDSEDGNSFVPFGIGVSIGISF
jgi:hypothetical protein